MNASRSRVVIAMALGCAALAASPQDPVTSRVTLSHALPAMEGRRLTASAVEVVYGPGGSSAPHSHPCPVVGYVIEGSLRMQVQGEPAALYKAGESFYEAPDGVHAVSANASATEPARFVAFFVCDREAPLSSPVPAPERRQP